MADEGILRLHSFKNRINDIKENLLQIMKKAGKNETKKKTGSGWKNTSKTILSIT